jgi:hypothetical protein
MPAKITWLKPKSDRVLDRFVSYLKFKFYWINDNLQVWLVKHMPAYAKLLCFYLVCRESPDSDIGKLNEWQLAENFKRAAKFDERNWY